MSRLPRRAAASRRNVWNAPRRVLTRLFASMPPPPPPPPPPNSVRCAQTRFRAASGAVPDGTAADAFTLFSPLLDRKFRRNAWGIPAENQGKSTKRENTAMNMKTAIAAFAVAAATVASAVEFKWQLNPNYEFKDASGNVMQTGNGRMYVSSGTGTVGSPFASYNYVKGQDYWYSGKSESLPGYAKNGTYRYSFALVNGQTSSWWLDDATRNLYSKIGGEWTYNGETYTGFWNMVEEVTKTSDFQYDFKDANGNVFATIKAAGVVPEPTSGLLLLLGTGMLALRRKAVCA